MSIGELEFVNAFIGFCRPSGPNWPTPLLALGYRVVGVEREFTTSNRGKDRTVTPDVALSSGQLAHVLLVDAKSQTVSDSQARTYTDIRPAELYRQGAFIEQVDPSHVVKDAVYTTLSSNATPLKSDMDRAGCHVPIIQFDGNTFSLFDGAFGCDDLATVFGKGIVVSQDDWPRHHVHFGAGATFSEMAPSVTLAMIRSLMDKGEFSVADIRDQVVRHWELCGRKERITLTKRITQLISLAAAEEFNDYIVRNEKVPEWRSHSGRPLTHHQQVAALQARATTFCFRLAADIEFKPGQPPLLHAEMFDTE